MTQCEQEECAAEDRFLLRELCRDRIMNLEKLIRFENEKSFSERDYNKIDRLNEQKEIYQGVYQRSCAAEKNEKKFPLSANKENANKIRCLA